MASSSPVYTASLSLFPDGKGENIQQGKRETQKEIDMQFTRFCVYAAYAEVCTRSNLRDNYKDKENEIHSKTCRRPIPSIFRWSSRVTCMGGRLIECAFACLYECNSRTLPILHYHTPYSFRKGNVSRKFSQALSLLIWLGANYNVGVLSWMGRTFALCTYVFVPRPRKPQRTSSQT